MGATKSDSKTSWQVKGWFDWFFTGASFVVFLCLEAALLYAYFTFLNSFK